VIAIQLVVNEKKNIFHIRLTIMKGTTSRNAKLWSYEAKELSVTDGNRYKILKAPPIFQKYVQTRVKMEYKYFTIHSDLFLCPGYIPGKVGIHKKW